MKPIINLADLVFHSDGPEAPGSHASISDKIGAEKLGYNISVCPPGKSICPFHNHRVNEEMFFILEGEGLLRFGDQEYPLKKHDFVACPPGGRDVAHQMINTGRVDLIYLALSTKIREELCEYPDSNKVGVYIGHYGAFEYKKIFQADTDVNYLVGETSERLKK